MNKVIADHPPAPAPYRQASASAFGKGGALLTQHEKELLLALARRAIEAHLGLSPAAEMPAEVAQHPALLEPRGAFVTLHLHGRLRGCIGYVDTDLPLWKVIARSAVNAASRDPRFEPVQAREVPELEIEISALTVPHPIEGPGDIEIGRHGLIIERPLFRGLLLPQVAPEWGFDAEGFLDAVAEKADLPADAWRGPGARLWAFEAEIFAETGRRS